MAVRPSAVLDRSGAAIGPTYRCRQRSQMTSRLEKGTICSHGALNFYLFVFSRPDDGFFVASLAWCLH